VLQRCLIPVAQLECARRQPVPATVSVAGRRFDGALERTLALRRQEPPVSLLGMPDDVFGIVKHAVAVVSADSRMASGSSN
jgi:hypothetical protein